MTSIHDRHRIRGAEQTPASPAAPAAPARIGNQSMEALARGAEAPSAENMGHRVDLPEAIRARMENAFGADFGDVRLYESQAVADAGADAVAMGSRIAFAPGKLDFSSSGGQALLGHELSHVVSQARGEASGRGFLSDRALEARADREGALAAAGESVYTGPVTPLSNSSVTSAAGPMQASKQDKRAQASAVRREQYRKKQEEEDDQAKQRADQADQELRERDPEAWEKKKDLYEAAGMMQSIVEQNRPKRDFEHEQLVENYVEYDENIKNASWLKRKFGKFKSPFKEKKISFKQYEKEFAQVEDMLMNTIAGYTGEQKVRLTDVDLTGLDEKKMLAQANHMQAVARDFQGLDFGGVKVSQPDPFTDDIPEEVVMDSDPGSKVVRVNQNLWKPGAAIPYPEENWSAAGEDFTMVHELGHLVNYQLRDRLNKKRPENNRLNSNMVANALLADALAAEAEEDEDLKALLYQHAGLDANAKLTGKNADQDALRSIAGALSNTTGQNGEQQRSALMEALLEKGYTSKYGGTDAAEMYAEAFAAHYSNEHEKSTYAPNEEVLNRKYNPLSSRIVKQSQLLFQNQKKLNKFHKRYWGQ